MRVIALVCAALLIMLVGISVHSYATGPQPNNCKNLYVGNITKARITYPGGSVDPLAHPNSTIVLRSDQTYSLWFVIHTYPQNVNGNTSAGTVWYSTNFPNYHESSCYPYSPSPASDPVVPNADVNISANGIYSSYHYNQSVFWQTINTYPPVSWTPSSNGFQYTVVWTPAMPTNLFATIQNFFWFLVRLWFRF